jgi:16S rRNA (cytosine1402-N4)-methyltransferase
MSHTVHVPILLAPIVASLLEPFLALAPGSEPHWLVDCTLGGGGHAAALLEGLPKPHRLLAFDRDATAIERARLRFGPEIGEGRLELVHAPFSEAARLILERPVRGLLADLGFSSDQLDDPSRGLSFNEDGPLDMRLDPSRGMGAYEFLSQVKELELERILREYGEERFSRRIAAGIIQQRRETNLPRTTKELSLLIIRSLPAFARHGKIHAATRSFQALRIAVNQELEELDSLLETGIMNVRPGGRVAILSFHSLEDRRVKTAFKRDGFRVLTKKPLEADEAETAANPRARSAKLRIAERV